MELRYEIYLGEMDFESRVALNELTRQRERNIGEYQKGYDATCQEIKKMSEEYSAYRIISQLDGKKFQDENSGEARSLFRETDGARK